MSAQVNSIDIALDQEHPYVAACLDDCNRMHQAVQGLFEGEDGILLYRVRDGELNIRTDRELKTDELPGGFEVVRTSPLEMPEAGAWMFFRLDCAPTGFSPGERRRRFLRKQSEREKWLLRRAEESGFRLRALDEQELFRVHGHRGRQDIAVRAASYLGTLEVVDAERFAEAMRQGIGGGKAYGLGMLVLDGELT